MSIPLWKFIHSCQNFGYFLASKIKSTNYSALVHIIALHIFIQNTFFRGGFVFREDLSLERVSHFVMIGLETLTALNS